MQKPSIKWEEKTVPLVSLVLNKNNPRRISKEQFAKLKASLAETGYHQRILVTTDSQVIGGHQRIRALRELGVTEVNVLMPDRDLTEDEYRRLLVQDNISFGDFDMDMLANDFMPRELIDWGFPDFKTDLASSESGLVLTSDKEADNKNENHKNMHKNTCPSCGHVF